MIYSWSLNFTFVPDCESFYPALTLLVLPLSKAGVLVEQSTSAHFFVVVIPSFPLKKLCRRAIASEGLFRLP